MLSVLPEEGLSKPAKALLKLLKWAEQKESLQKEAQQKDERLERNSYVAKKKDNTNYERRRRREN